MLFHGSFRDGLASDVDQNFGLYIGILVLYTICATAGTFTVVALPTALFDETQSYLVNALSMIAAGVSVFPILLRGFALHLLIFFLLSLASVKKGLMAFGFAALAFTGLAAGFGSRMLIVAFGVRGTLLSFLCIWLAEAILFPCRMKGMQLAIGYARNHDKSGARLQFGLCIAIASLGVFWQCMAAPLIVQRLFG